MSLLTSLNNIFKILSIIIVCSLFQYDVTQAQSFDPEFETGRIMEIHNRQRDLHFNKDLDALSQITEGFISVNKGVIQTPSVEENRLKWKNYFDSVEFMKWDDIVPPIIRFSDDGTMAYTVVNKEIVVQYLDENKKRKEETTIFAWVAIYKKYSTGWQIDCIVSTNQPPVIK